MSKARTTKLSITDHSRNSAGLRYVYPVVSRRAGGLSIGINLNPNNACNWRCIYCQVADLVRGAAPEIDGARLQRELRGFLENVQSEDFYDEFGVEHQFRRISDIAISGNGEPTSVRDLKNIISLVGTVINEYDLGGKINFVLITNGSLVHHDNVQKGLMELAAHQGEIWYKLDRATDAGLKLVNNAGISASRGFENLVKAARLCPTRVQTCVFGVDGKTQSSSEQQAYLDLLNKAFLSGVHIRGVLLYGLARPSLQPEASRLNRVDAEYLVNFAQAIRELGLSVSIHE